MSSSLAIEPESNPTPVKASYPWSHSRCAWTTSHDILRKHGSVHALKGVMRHALRCNRIPARVFGLHTTCSSSCSPATMWSSSKGGTSGLSRDRTVLPRTPSPWNGGMSQLCLTHNIGLPDSLCAALLTSIPPASSKEDQDTNAVGAVSTLNSGSRSVPIPPCRYPVTLSMPSAIWEVEVLWTTPVLLACVSIVGYFMQRLCGIRERAAPESTPTLSNTIVFNQLP